MSVRRLLMEVELASEGAYSQKPIAKRQWPISNCYWPGLNKQNGTNHEPISNSYSLLPCSSCTRWRIT